MDEHSQLLEHIIHLQSHFMHKCAEMDMQRGKDSRWLSLDLTMPQLKAIMIVVSSQGVTIGQLAKKLGVGLPTASGIVDRLYEHGFVTRSEDPEDRRVTRVLATPKSLEIMEKMYNSDMNFLRQLLGMLDVEDLRTIRNAFDILLKLFQRAFTAATDDEAEHIES